MTPAMVERVARAIFPEAFPAWDQYQREPGWGPEAGALARKPVDEAIERVKRGMMAMREPTPGMIERMALEWEACHEDGPDDDCKTGIHVWRGGIDAATKGE